jgi:tetratricopeptide (TPR) repeat protein
MAETIIYNDNTYKRVNGKWVDKNGMVVTHLQKTLDNLFAKQQPKDNLTAEQLIAEGDKYKEAGSPHLAIQYYEAALKTKTVLVHKSVLPRLTSCYRMQGQAIKAIEIFESAKATYGEKLMSSPLCTSVAAAYCDIKDYESAKKLADKAYAMGGGKASGELASVYGRIRKETTGSGAFVEV